MTVTSRNKGKPSPRWAFMQRFVIKDRVAHDEDYLVRTRIVQTPWFGVYLHRILLPDADLNPHTHPWSFSSLILQGSYVEHVYDSFPAFDDGVMRVARHGRFSFHRFPRGAAHRINWAAPGLTTLVFVGRRRESWEFWHHTVHGAEMVDWQDYTDDMVRTA